MNLLLQFVLLASFSMASTADAFAKKPEKAPSTQPPAAEQQAQPVTSSQQAASAPVSVEAPQVAQTATATPSASVQASAAQPATAGNINIDFQTGLSKLAEKTLGGVVNISTTQVINGRSGLMGGAQGGDMPRMAPGSPFDELFREFFGQMEQAPRKVQSLGSGFIVKIQGDKAYVVTNYHVVAEAKKITVTLNNRIELDATIHGRDERTDLAVLVVDLSKTAANRRPYALEWSPAQSTRVGHFVAAIGNAFGLGNTLTFGVVSFKGRDLMARKHDYVDDFIQHTAPINMGNSGGPLLNMDGKIIGINTAIFTPTGGHVGIGFSIPSELAQKTVDALIEHGRVRRGWLGLNIQAVENVQTTETAERMIIVGSVKDDSPCKGILQRGDFILKFNGIALDHDNRLTRLVGETVPGTSVTLEVSRKGENKPRTVTVVVGEAPDSVKADVAVTATQEAGGKKSEAVSIPLLGLSVREGADKRGLVIEKLDELSPARDVGLQPRDVITEANRMDVKTVADLNKAIKAVQDSQGHTILMCIRRGSVNSIIKGSGTLIEKKAGNTPEDEGVFFVSVKLYTEELKKTLESDVQPNTTPPATAAPAQG